jgi:hypothetical protein
MTGPARFVTQPPVDPVNADGAPIEPDRNGLQILDRAECLRLLGTATLGRVGITIGALPVVLPITFRLVGEQIIFRTGAGTKLDAATHNNVVAFEVDDFEPFSHAGWSVVVTGVARSITDADERVALQASPIPRWAPTGDDRVISIDTTMISGRRVTSPDDGDVSPA